MKVLSQSILNALANTGGVRHYASLRIYRQRTFFELANTTDYTPNFDPGAGIRYESVTPQAVGYDATNVRKVTAANNGGVLRLMVDGSATVVTPSGVSQFGSENGVSIAWPYIFYSGNTSVYRAEINPSSLYAGNAACLTSNSAIVTIPSGVVHAISGTLAFHLWIDQGGVRVSALSYSGSWTRSDSTGRFMFPGEAWPVDTMHMSKLNYSTAVQVGTNEYGIYMTAPTGEVLGMRYLASSNSWSDVFVAIPHDLTAFYVSSSLRDTNGRIHLQAQFKRTEEQDAGVIYTLNMRSDDGMTFAMDRSALITNTGHRYQAVYTPNGFFYSALNRYYLAPKQFQAYGTGAETLSLTQDRISEISGEPGSSCEVAITDGDESLMSNPLVDEGALCKLDIGVQGTSGILWHTDWETMVLVSKEIDIKRRRVTLSFQQEGLWLTESTTYPMYMELQSKQSVWDNASELSNLYTAPQSAGTPNPFWCDFWAGDNLTEGGLRPKDHGEYLTYTYVTGDLKAKNNLTDYPVFNTSAFPLEIKVYGWSRSGLPDTNPNTPDPTPTTAVTDDINIVLHISRSGVDKTFEYDNSDARDAINFFPETWHPTNPRAGYCPIIFEIANANDTLQDGDQLVSIDLKYTTTGGPTVFHAERVEIPNITQYISTTSEESTWEKVPSDVPITQLDMTEYLAGYDSGIEKIAPWEYVFDSMKSTGTYGEVHFTLKSAPTGVDEGDPGVLVVRVKATIERLDSTPPTSIAVATNAWEYDKPLVGTGGYSDIVFSEDAVVGDSLTVDISDDFDNPMTFVKTGTFALRFYRMGITSMRLEILGIFWDIPPYGNPGTTYKTAWTQSLNVLPEDIPVNLSYEAKGIPSILYSVTPNYTFNFQAMASFKLEGDYAWCGVIGLSNDAKNFIGARIGKMKAQIVKCRNGITTVLVEASTFLVLGTATILFEQRDGHLKLWLKEWYTTESTDPLDWPLTTKIEYEWQEADGPMAVDPLVMHVGAYTLIDAPRFPICGFYQPDCDGIPLLPGYSLSALSSFPSSGKVSINGIKYNYASRAGMTNQGRGPFMPCNTGNWGPYANPSSGISYSKNNTCELTYFDWLESKEAWAGYLIGSNAGYCWQITNTDWRVFITTGGQVVYLKNRARFFGIKINPSDMVSATDKVWITSGLTGITIAEGDATVHGEGSLCCLDTNDKVTLISFGASSGDRDASLRDLISTIAGWAGARVTFPGDKTNASIALQANVETSL